MSGRTITIEHNGETYYGQIAKVESTHLGTEDHGILTAYLHCQGDGWGIGVGGYGLDQPFDHVLAMARTVGVSRWEDLPGREVIVLFDGKHSLGARAVGIAHISDEKRVLILSEHAESWKTREEAAR